MRAATILPLTASWMAYGLVIGLLLAVVAALAESALRAAGRPGRWAWAAALGLTVALVAIAPQRAVQPLLLRVSTTTAAVTAPAAAVPAWGERTLGVLASAAQTVAEPLRWTVGAASQALPPGIGGWARGGCCSASRSSCSSRPSTRASIERATAGPSLSCRGHVSASRPMSAPPWSGWRDRRS